MIDNQVESVSRTHERQPWSFRICFMGVDDGLREVFGCDRTPTPSKPNNTMTDPINRPTRLDISNEQLN